jgi:ubiquitin C-terminal hydrolase
VYNGYNNCFPIAILNIFFNLNDIINLQNYQVSENNNNIEEISLDKMFIDLVKASKREIIPISTQFRNKLGQLYPIFNNQNQHDAQEFYTAFVQIVHKATAVLIEVDDLYNSIIKDTFTGLFTYIYECTICNRKH